MGIFVLISLNRNVLGEVIKYHEFEVIKYYGFLKVIFRLFWITYVEFELLMLNLNYLCWISITYVEFEFQNKSNYFLLILEKY